MININSSDIDKYLSNSYDELSTIKLKTSDNFFYKKTFNNFKILLKK